MKLRSLLTCSLFYITTTTKKNSELRIHYVFPCSVTLKIEFSRENNSLDNGKNLASLKCLHKLIDTDVTSQIFYFTVQLTILNGSFSKSRLTIVESWNKVIFFAKHLAENVSPMIFLDFARPITLIYL